MDGGGRGSGGQPAIEPPSPPWRTPCGRLQASSVAGQGSGEDWGKGDGDPPPPRALLAAGGHWQILMWGRERIPQSPFSHELDPPGRERCRTRSAGEAAALSTCDLRRA
jgi:hypothetical protein